MNRFELDPNLLSVELDEDEVPDFEDIGVVHVDQVSGVATTYR